MLQVKLEVTLKLEGPILTKSSVPGRYGMDTSMALNYEGKYMIPGTLVKGRLRQAWKELRDLTSFISEGEIVKLLGDESGNRTNQRPVNPMRSIIKFSDFVSEKQGSKTFHRIRIDEKKGTVAEGAILTMESPFASGEEVCFYGSIDFIAKDQQEADKNIDYIKKGLRWIPGLGSERSVGFGKLLDVAINPKITEIKTTPKSVESTQDRRLGLVFIPKGPFCIAKRQINDNLYESEIFIPGGAIKGIIASTWLRLIGLTDCIEIKEDTDNSPKRALQEFQQDKGSSCFSC